MVNKIAHTVSPEHQRAVAQTIQREGLLDWVERTKVAGYLHAYMAAEVPPATEHIPSTTTQVELISPSWVTVKRAAAGVFEPQVDLLPAADVRSLTGEDLVARAEADGRVTISTESAVQQNLDDIVVEVIRDYGIFKVQRLDSDAHLLGWAITNVIDFTMTAVPLTLFTTGDVYALQESVAGVRVSMGTALPRSVPKVGDHGCFYYVSTSGRVTATVPVTLSRAETVGGVTSWVAVDLWGETLKLKYAPQLKAIAEMGKKEYAIPDTMSWMRLHKEVRLVPDPVLFTKTAAADATCVGTIEHHDRRFFLRGSPFAKVSSAWREGLVESDAEFVLRVAGVSVRDAREKMARAVLGEEVEVRAHQLTPAAEKRAGVERVVSAWKEKVDPVAASLRRDTVKIAAFLSDVARPGSVDALLSLNFINGDNLGLFVESLPHLEVARRDLAELYLACMVGLPDVPTTAIIRAMEALRDVCMGLTKLRMRTL